MTADRVVPASQPTDRTTPHTDRWRSPTVVSAISGLAVLALAAAAWVMAVAAMSGMDMGVATPRGTFGRFVALWTVMMAAMMLPGIVPAVSGRARVGGVPAAGRFALSYLAVWAVVGVVAYAVDRPHGTLAAGLVTLAAGVYELTPVKRGFRRRCRDGGGPGAAFGLHCVGSSIGLMAVYLALGAMSVTWMVVVTVVITGQKLLPVRAAVDVPVGLAMLALGAVVLIA